MFCSNCGTDCGKSAFCSSCGSKVDGERISNSAKKNLEKPDWGTIQEISNLWTSGDIVAGLELASSAIDTIRRKFPNSDELPDETLAIFATLALQVGLKGADIGMAQSPTFETFLKKSKMPDFWRDQLTLRLNIRKQISGLGKFSQLEGNFAIQKFWLGETEMEDGIFAIMNTSSSEIGWWIDEFEFSSVNLASLFAITFLDGNREALAGRRELAFNQTIQIINSLVSWPDAQEFGLAVDEIVANWNGQ